MRVNKKYDYWIHSSKFTAITKFSNLFIGILSFMVLARALGHHDASAFGVWGLFMTISSITETARISLIRNAYIRYINQTAQYEHESLQAGAFILSLFISMVLAILFFSLSSTIAHLLNASGLEVMLRWYAATLLINTYFAHFEMTLTANMNFRAVSFMYVTRQFFLLSIITLFWLMKFPLSPGTLSIIYLSSVIVGGITGFKLASTYLKWNLKSYRKWFSKLWSFGKFVFGTNISALLFRSTDNFLTSAYISTAVSAFYNACTRISNMVDIPSQVLADVAFTKATQLDSSNKKEIKNMYEKTVGAILTFSFPALIFLLAFPSFVLQILAGSTFMAAAPILRITAFFGFILPFLKQYGTIMDATGHPQINFRTNLLALIFNIIFNIIGIHFLGFIGAACGTACTYFVIFIITQRILYKKFGISFLQVFRNTFDFYLRLFRIAKQYTLGSLSTIKA